MALRFDASGEGVKKDVNASKRLYERRARAIRPTLRRWVLQGIGSWWLVSTIVQIEVAERERLRAQNPRDPGYGRLEIEQILTDQLLELIESHNYALPAPKQRKGVR